MKSNIDHQGGASLWGSAAILLAGLAACQPQARQLLLLDLARTDPVAIEATARPWLDAGYTVRYRRFYPHLTRSDPERYHTLVLLGGRSPDPPTDALTAGDLVVLTTWVSRGGAVVLGYAGDGEGAHDRWVMNRWLAAVGAGIEIGAAALLDTAIHTIAGFTPRPGARARHGAPPRGAPLGAFPAGRAHRLHVSDERRALAYSDRLGAAAPDAPVIAAGRVGQGLVVVASRHTLAALGADVRPATTPLAPLGALTETRAFLVALARWTRRPAEWAAVPPAERGTRLALGDAPLTVRPHPPPLEPPPGARAVRLTVPRSDASLVRTQAPRWIARNGLRLLWGDDVAPRGAALDSLIGFLEVGSFNAVATLAAPGGDILSDSATARWRETATRLAQTSLRWFPVLRLADFRPPPDTLGGGWCALDPRLWAEGLAVAYAPLARLAAESPDIVAGITLDLDVEGRRATPGDGLGPEPCDATYRAVLSALALDSARTARLGELRVAARHDALLDAGLLAGYYDVLERAVALRAWLIARATRRSAPNVLLALRDAVPPDDWLALGVLRGFAAAAAPSPVLVWSHTVRSRPLVAAYRRRGAAVLHAVGLSPRFVPPATWPRLRSTVFSDNDGFWVASAERILAGPRTPQEPLSADSLARLVRRLTR
jgi:hypothetical protein